MTTKGVVLRLVLIVALGACLRILACGGLVGTDDGTYADLARRIVDGQCLSTHSMDLGSFPLRVGVLGPRP